MSVEFCNQMVKIEFSHADLPGPVGKLLMHADGILILKLRGSDL